MFSPTYLVQQLSNQSQQVLVSDSEIIEIFIINT